MGTSLSSILGRRLYFEVNITVFYFQATQSTIHISESNINIYRHILYVKIVIFLLLTAVKHKWKVEPGRCSLADLQHVGVDMETDIGTVVLATESRDVTAYLKVKTESRNPHVALILRNSMLLL